MKIYDSKFRRVDPGNGSYRPLLWDETPNLSKPPRRTVYREPKPFEPGSHLEWKHAQFGDRVLDKHLCVELPANEDRRSGTVWSDGPHGGAWVILDAYSNTLALVLPATKRLPIRANRLVAY